ncbi:MAG: cytochrome P460 family protein [Pseudomonadales bacterium]
MFKWLKGCALAATAGLSVLTGQVLADSMTGMATGLSPWVSDKGQISLPEDFRQEMAHLGSWFVPEGGAAGFHDVYAQREAVEAYRKTGMFPDGAVLVKELRSAEAADYTTGKGVNRATGKILQTFVMVKDSQNRFADSAQWGDGWGWALFKPGSAVNVSTDYQNDCLGCHTPAKKTDWVYIEGYPTLNK